MWATHYRNVVRGTIQELFHDEKKLLSLLESDLNLFVHGPTGCGKKCMISKYFDEQSGNWSLVEYTSDGPQKQSVQLMTRTGGNHMELHLTDSIKNKRLVIMNIMRNLCSRFSVDAFGNPSGTTLIIYDMHHVSQSLMKMFAVFVANHTNCRFVFVSNKWYEQLSSGCISYRFERRNLRYVHEYMTRLCRQCDVMYTSTVMEDIYEQENGDIVQCIMQYDLWHSRIENTKVSCIQWVCDELSKQIPNFTQIRASYYQLLVNNVTGTHIILYILKELLRRRVKCVRMLSELVRLASVYEHRMVIGEREIYHLDAFGVNVAQCLKQPPPIIEVAVCSS